jgi:hypothetical protein
MSILLHQLHSVKNRFLLIIVVLFAIGTYQLLQAELSRAHLGMESDLFLGFYYFIPAILWIICLPLIRRIAGAIVISGNWPNWLSHLAISVVFACILKIVALIVDFTIQSWIGTMTGSLLAFIIEIRFLFIASIPENILTYWGILLLLTFTDNVTGDTSGKVFAQSIQIKLDAGAMLRIPCNEIVQIEAFGNYLKIHTAVETFCVRQTIKSIQQTLDPQDFFRLQRSFIVNANYIQSIRRLGDGCYHVALPDNITIKAGRAYRGAVRTLLTKYGRSVHHK